VKKEKKKKSSSREQESFIPVVLSKFNPNLTKRQLEMEAYAGVIAAFRAQGELTWKKDSVLQDLRAMLKISDERHKMELRQADDALSLLNFPINKKQKQGNAADAYESDSLSSDWESNSEDETGKRKKQKTDKYQLGAFALPNSDNNQAGFVSKIPQKRNKKKERKKVPKAIEIKPEEPAFENLPPEVLEAKETGDLEKLKAALQKHQEQVRAELAALSNGQNLP